MVTDLVDAARYSKKLRSWWGEGSFEALILTTADRDEILFSVPHCHSPFGQSLETYNNKLGTWISNFRNAMLKRSILAIYWYGIAPKQSRAR